MSETAQVNPYIFRMYDIRGTAGNDISVDIALLIGRAFGTFIRQKYGDAVPKIAVGRDNRSSSPELHAAVCRGLNASGCDVVDTGLTPSPLLGFVVADQGLDGGINVTASHNPPDQNGFKLIGREAYPIAEDDILSIRNMIVNGEFAVGHGTTFSADPTDDYLSKLRKLISIQRSLKVVVDTGNGVAGVVVPRALMLLGCEVVELYCELDSRFPNHIPNPEKPENMRDLQTKVVETQADIGLAFDGDGDRLGVVDERGERYDADKILILLSRDLLSRHHGAKILVDVKSSKNVFDDIRSHGGIPVMTRTGHSLIKRQIHQDRTILLAGEFSGHMFPVEEYYIIDDALLAACRLLESLSRQDKPLSGLLGELPKRFSTGLIEVKCSDWDKFAVVDTITRSLSRRYEVTTIDGVRVEFGDGWALVRASNTSPTLTLRFEAEYEKRLQEIQQVIYDELGKFPSVELPG